MHTNEPWPDVAFKVFTASGRYVGYASSGSSDCCVYPPGGEDDGFFGSISGDAVEFSSGERCGLVEGTTLYYYPDGGIAATIQGNEVLDLNSVLIGTLDGGGSNEERLGAVMLLILNRWLLANGRPNLDVR